VSPRTLAKRVKAITESLTFETWDYVRQGLFEKHKTIVVTMLTTRMLVRSGELVQGEVSHLVKAKLDDNPGNIPEKIKSFMKSDVTWSQIKALTYIPEFNEIHNALVVESLQWRKWNNEEKPEECDLPKSHKDISEFHKIMLIKIMRPDRVTAALRNYVRGRFGDRYIDARPFDIYKTNSESTKLNPLFFVLFPGVDPIPLVLESAAKLGKTKENGKLELLSMGQGMEPLADRLLKQ
jgi:dynein heavy chain